MPKTFDQWWEDSGQHWAAAACENGGTVWTDDMDERRELFERRYQKPKPPNGMTTIKSIRSYQRNNYVECSEDGRPSTDMRTAA